MKRGCGLTRHKIGTYFRNCAIKNVRNEMFKAFQTHLGMFNSLWWNRILGKHISYVWNIQLNIIFLFFRFHFRLRLVNGKEPYLFVYTFLNTASKRLMTRRTHSYNETGKYEKASESSDFDWSGFKRTFWKKNLKEMLQLKYTLQLKIDFRNISEKKYYFKKDIYIYSHIVVN